MAIKNCIFLFVVRQGMDIEAAEKWIVDLIRGSKLDAKIDSRDNNVIMGGSYPSVYQQARGFLQFFRV